MDVLRRIAWLRDERGWSNYKLAKAAGISQTTIGHMFTRNTQPSIATLESICDGFGITLSQFFSDDNGMVSLSGEQRELLDRWGTIPKEQKVILLELLKKM
ncbi:MAG: helix-turn-helix transcriptional regulator [Clostridiales bacterium]|jgi:transcriptional regulator with XRE-family HTH domain|nr:helix-turn-helix transcriptional regulator [Clostridiales bacterium]